MHSGLLISSDHTNSRKRLVSPTIAKQARWLPPVLPCSQYLVFINNYNYKGLQKYTHQNSLTIFVNKRFTFLYLLDTTKGETKTLYSPQVTVYFRGQPRCGFENFKCEYNVIIPSTHSLLIKHNVNTAGLSSVTLLRRTNCNGGATASWRSGLHAINHSTLLSNWAHKSAPVMI